VRLGSECLLLEGLPVWTARLTPDDAEGAAQQDLRGKNNTGGGDHKAEPKEGTTTIPIG